MQADIHNLQQHHLRQQKKARTYVQNLVSSPQTQNEQKISHNVIKRAQTKVITTQLNANINQNQKNDNQAKINNFSGNIIQSQLSQRDKFQQIPLPSNTYEAHRRDSQSLLQNIQISTHSNSNVSPIDFSRFMKKEIKPSTGVSNKLKKMMYKQVLQDQLASYGLINKQTHNNIINSTPINSSQQTTHRSMKPSPRGTIQQVSQVNLMGQTQYNAQSLKSLPFLQTQYSPKQDSFLYKQAKVSSTTLVSEKYDFSSQARLNSKEQRVQDQQQCFAEIKDNIFQIKRQFQDRVDSELSNPDSAILLLLQKKGYNPSCISFYFSKLIESTIQNFNYQHSQNIKPFQLNNQTKNQITRQNSIKLECPPINIQNNQTPITSMNNININTTNNISNTARNNISSNDKYQIVQYHKQQSLIKGNDSSRNINTVYNYNYNNNVNNFSFEKEQYSLSTAPQSFILGKGSKTTRDTSHGLSLLRTKTEESLSHIPSLPFIPFINDKQKTVPMFTTNGEFPYFCSNSVDELSIEEDECDIINSLENLENKGMRKRASTESQSKPFNATLGTLSSQNLKKQQNLFFKMPSQVFDELLQFLLVILKKNIQSKVEINYLIKFLNEQKPEYTPQNLIEEFGSDDRLHQTTKKVFQNLIKEGILSEYIDDNIEIKDDTLLKFVNSLVCMDRKKLEQYSQIINSKAKISFVEFYLIKQKIHQSLQQIFDQEERLFLLPLIMEAIEKVRYIFLLQRENHILDDPSLIQKVKKEISMKLYINCPPEYFEEYIAPKIKQQPSSSTPFQQRNIMSFQNNQVTQTQFYPKSNKNKNTNNRNEVNTPYNHENFSRQIEILQKQGLDSSRQNDIISKQTLDTSKQIDIFKSGESDYSRQSDLLKTRKSVLVSQNSNYANNNSKSPFNNQNNIVQKENLLSYLISPKRSKLVENNQNFPLKKRFSAANGLTMNNMNGLSQLLNNDSHQQHNSQIKQQDSNQIINKQSKIQYFEDLASQLIEKTLVQPDIKELKQILEKRIVRLDVKIIDFLKGSIEEILIQNQVEQDIIIDIKVRLSKLKWNLISNFQREYENEEFRMNMQHSFTELLEKQFKSQKNKSIYVRFIPIFDYILNNYLSISDLYSNKDINFSLSFTDFTLTQIQIFKQCVKQTLLISLPQEIKSLIDFSEPFFN